MMTWDADRIIQDAGTMIWVWSWRRMIDFPEIIYELENIVQRGYVTERQVHVHKENNRKIKIPGALVPVSGVSLVSPPTDP